MVMSINGSDALMHVENIYFKVLDKAIEAVSASVVCNHLKTSGSIPMTAERKKLHRRPSAVLPSKSARLL